MVADGPRELSTGTMLEAVGGTKGLLDSSLPATVFVLVRLFGPLNAAIVAAVLVGLAVVVLRRVRGEPLQQALSGFFGLLLAVVISRSTGTGKGFFLPGILITAGSGVIFTVSLLLRKPAVALALAAFDQRYAVWPTHAALRRACVLSTAVWAASFFVRAAVASAVALSVGDGASDNVLLLVVINAVKWPLIIGSALLTVALVRRAEVPELAEPTSP